jgi:hypothetical protein
MPEPISDSLSYDWAEFRDHSLDSRFPEWAIGYSLWRDFSYRLESLEDFKRFQQGMARERERRRGNGVLPNGITRVFVSHKQENRDEALRVAWIIQNKGHHFWLDVLEPTLQSNSLRPIQVAGIIEMALLNCSHVIVLITDDSVRSRWIPYEYGRAKEPTPYSLNAASWLHPAINQKIPEYLYLGVMTGSEKDIYDWLPPALQPGPPWSGPEPPPLPR